MEAVLIWLLFSLKLKFEKDLRLAPEAVILDEEQEETKNKRKTPKLRTIRNLNMRIEFRIIEKYWGYWNIEDERLRKTWLE